ncbi:hypothetical protein Tco_0623361 [Tanacetum coccineum]
METRAVESVGENTDIANYNAKVTGTHHDVAPKCSEDRKIGCRKSYEVMVKENKDKSDEKRLDDVPTIRDFPEVFPEDLPGLPPIRQTKEEHDVHLRLILELLKKEEFEGIHVDPAKIESIKDWEHSKTPTRNSPIIKVWPGLSSTKGDVLEGGGVLSNVTLSDSSIFLTSQYNLVRSKDQDDPHDDAHPEGENSAKRQKTSEYEAYVSGESSAGQDNVEEPGPSTSGNQEQDDEFDFWTDSYASDDDEIPTKQVSQDIMEEISLTINEAKLKKMAERKMADEMC